MPRSGPCGPFLLPGGSGHPGNGPGRRSPSTGGRVGELGRDPPAVTFYCPLELLEAVEAEMARSGRSKTGVIVDALQAHLAGS